MIELVLTVCLLSSPSECREERPEYIGASLSSCMLQGQFYAAQWVEQHPSFRVARWRCEPSEGRKIPI